MLVEMLAAYSILLLIILTFIPLMMEGKAAKDYVIQRAEAQYLLYEQLTAYMDGQISPLPQELERNNQRYELIWKEDPRHLGLLEGCISYENNKGQQEFVCDFVK